MWLRMKQNSVTEIGPTNLPNSSREVETEATSEVGSLDARDIMVPAFAGENPTSSSNSEGGSGGGIYSDAENLEAGEVDDDGS